MKKVRLAGLLGQHVAKESEIQRQGLKDVKRLGLTYSKKVTEKLTTMGGRPKFAFIKRKR